MAGLEVPDPALRSATLGIVLRPWHPDDAAALAAAWSDAEIARHCAVPPDHDEADAAGWIAGTAERHATGDTLDLVIAGLRSGAVLGEVGIRRLTRPTSARPGVDAWELGWWVMPAHRGQGLCAGSVNLLA